MRKYKLKQITQDSRVKRNPVLWSIVCIKGQHLLCMPDGTVVPGVILTRVTDAVNEMAVAMVKLNVNLDEIEDVLHT